VAKKIELIKLKIDLEGLKDFKSLTREIGKLDKSLKPTRSNLKSLAQSIKEVSKVTPKTISQFKQKDRVLKKLREEVNVNGRAFKRLGTQIDANRKKLQAFNQTAKKGQAGVGTKVAQGFASSIAASALPGFTSQGAITGALLGGPKGAAIGAGIGAGIDFALFTKSATEYAAQVGRLRIGLKGVTKDSRTYSRALAIIQSVSDELNVPILDATKQFTQLSASVLGAGGTIKDAETVFRGVSEAIKATGGDAEDIKSGIRAMSQIFGKGKVSAEELSGQLGERLAGAVVKFAEANGSTLQQLQKDLRDGVVDLNKVINFTKRISKDHRDAALEMASSSEESGERMKNAFLGMKFELGIIFKDIGADFNDMITGFLKQLRNLFRAFNELQNRDKARKAAREAVIDEFGVEGVDFTDKNKSKISQLGSIFSFNALKTKLGRQANKYDFLDIIPDSIDFAGGRKPQGLDTDPTKLFDDVYNKQLGLEILDDLDTMGGKFPIFGSQKNKDKAAIKYKLELGLINQKEFENLQIKREAELVMAALGDEAEKFNLTLDIVKAKLKEARNDTYNFKEEFRKVAESAMDLQNNIEELAVNSINKLADGFAELAVSGKASFGDLARSILADLQRMIIKALFFKALFGLFPGLETFLGFEKGGVVEKSAKGNVFAKNNVKPFYRGGVVDKPSIFPMARGVGLMAEKGPEAIMPLKRGANGKLGVQASGGVGNIVVNVDASGSSVEGNSQQSAELGKMLGAVVQAELIKQKRPGGLLG